MNIDWDVGLLLLSSSFHLLVMPEISIKTEHKVGQIAYDTLGTFCLRVLDLLIFPSLSLYAARC